MALLSTTVAGAANLAETFTFPALPEDQMWRIQIHSVAASSAPGAGGAATDLRFELRPPGSVPPSQRIVFFEDAGPVDNAAQVCSLLVPRVGPNDPNSWILVVTGTKGNTMTVTVDFEITILPASAE